MKRLLLFLLFAAIVRMADEENPPVQSEQADQPEEMTSEQKLDDVRQRLLSIEEKIDHLLYHSGHDVTPHEIQYSPLGPVMMPVIHDSKSPHVQMKTHDIMRGGMVNPYTFGYPGVGGYYGGYPPLF